MKMEDLKDIRKEITKIDNEMAILFERRMELVVKVAEYKKHKGLPIFDPKREEQVVAGGIERISSSDIKPYYKIGRASCRERV